MLITVYLKVEIMAKIFTKGSFFDREDSFIVYEEFRLELY